MILNTKRIHNSFEEISPQELNICLQKFSLSARKSDDRGRSVIARQKIVIVAGNSKRVKNDHFFAQLSHCFSIYENNYSPQCRWLVVKQNRRLVMSLH